MSYCQLNYFSTRQGFLPSKEYKLFSRTFAPAEHGCYLSEFLFESFDSFGNFGSFTAFFWFMIKMVFGAARCLLMEARDAGSIAPIDIDIFFVKNNNRSTGFIVDPITVLHLITLYL